MTSPRRNMERLRRESPHPPNRHGDQCYVPWCGGTHLSNKVVATRLHWEVLTYERRGWSLCSCSLSCFVSGALAKFEKIHFWLRENWLEIAGGYEAGLHR